MSKVMLVANKGYELEWNPAYHYIGVDRGATILRELNIKMDYAIGDFDSISADELVELEKVTKIKKLPVRKNESDSEYAIRFALQHYDEVFITGVTGGRLDHFISLYHLLAFADVPFTIVDNQNVIYKRKVGKYEIKTSKKYLSLFACEPSIITIENVEYPLSKQCLQTSDVYTLSNESLQESSFVKVEKGSIVIIESDDKKNTLK
ncbi:thiamine pyrophosphokinase [Breznakia sp. PF5-3]|uniref:thiamine diphosphokinase n=1 Tax=unclassified Breznakia TaxID=2623764 RepID=UPI002406CBF3|nr:MULTISPECIES: thiamine diphosphokinase [unclassified Breznakia]MDF9825587.1 thiamine pyrophosphokinase [Breznakia sp. PM6-1]MDF9836422.1 thiamine pyrophosphokinase [Breznakia sp. PF5-3]MDF9838570.1 thiamine pyrophosphokinase [Breznakia sp. PFB2-8]MDF9860583.1 thiamine pyrophosphokinase [Breznakia sp. PH5-24]